MKFNKLLLGTSAIGALATSFPAVAQVAPQEPQADGQAVSMDSSETSEIIVTARRRAENIQDVPLSITAVTGDALAARGVRDVNDLQYQTPSLTVTAAGPTRHTVAYAIRGQRTQEVQLLSDAPVGTYFAEVIQPRTYGFGTAFYDLQNVQILKGVQGTLFGRNMTGGAVLVEPNHPQFDAFHAEGTAQYGNYDMRDFYGMVNLPVSENLAIRAAGKIRDRDGFTTDVSNGRDYDDQHFKAFRVSAELKLGRINSYTVFDYVRQREHGTAAKLVGYSLTDPLNGLPTVIGQQVIASPFFPIAAGVPPQDVVSLLNASLAMGKYKVNLGNYANGPLDGLNDPSFTNIKNYGITNKTTFEAGDVTFKNIFGYRRIEFATHTDFDGTPAALINSTQLVSTKNYSEEFQMQGTPFGSRFELTLGGYYFRESGEDGAITNNFPQLTSMGFATNIPALATYFLTQPSSFYIQSTVSHGTAISYAFYGAGTYKLTDNLKFSAGIRYNNDERKAEVNPFYPNLAIPFSPTLTVTGFCVYNAFGAFPLSQCRQKRTLKNNAVTWDATLQYEPTSLMTTYISTRHGYRAGGFNLRAQDDVTFMPFLPETVQEFEGGIKNEFDVGSSARLTTSAAAYFQIYKNIQRQNAAITSSGSIGTVVTNIGKQHNYGGEFEATLSFASGLNANLFYSYVKNDIVSGDLGSFPQQGSPKHQIGGGLSYSREIDGLGELSGNINATYRSSVHLDEFDSVADQKGYAIVNARLGVSNIAGTNFGIAAFVNNLTNTYYQTGTIAIISGGPQIGNNPVTGGPGYASSVYGEPRMYGVEASVKF